MSFKNKHGHNPVLLPLAFTGWFLTELTVKLDNKTYQIPKHIPVGFIAFPLRAPLAITSVGYIGYRFFYSLVN